MSIDNIRPRWAHLSPLGELRASGERAARDASAHTNRGRSLQIEIKFDRRVIALVVVFLILAGGCYVGWQTFQSGLELRQQTQWIKALATGADPSELNIPPGDRYGVALMAQMAKTSGISETDWQTFETEAKNQLRNGALYMAGSVLLAGFAIEHVLRRSPPKRSDAVAAAPAARVEPVTGDQQRDA